MSPDVAVGLCLFVALFAADVILATVIGSAIPRGNRDLEPGQGSADARRGGVDQLSHRERNT